MSNKESHLNRHKADYFTKTVKILSIKFHFQMTHWVNPIQSGTERHSVPESNPFSPWLITPPLRRYSEGGKESYRAKQDLAWIFLIEQCGLSFLEGMYLQLLSSQIGYRHKRALRRWKLANRLFILSFFLMSHTFAPEIKTFLARTDIWKM